MAEYRSGHYAAALEALDAAAKAWPNNLQVTGIAAFYRAMSLFRQGKEDPARQLALNAAAMASRATLPWVPPTLRRAPDHAVWPLAS